MSNPLFDKDFLYELDQYHHKEVYARVIALTFDERPIEQIEGKVTAGSINIDGSSAVRRTCSLSLVAKELNINDFYWGLTNKIKVEIGVKNYINSNYPDIIWFNQGIYIISSFSTSAGTNNYSVNLSGKDKMCLLNGEVGGSLPSAIDFGTMSIFDDSYTVINFQSDLDYEAHTYYIKAGDTYVLDNSEYSPLKTYYEYTPTETIVDITLDTIIREMVHKYGKEPYYNIIINDLTESGLQLLEYRGDTTLYLMYDEDNQMCTNMTTDSDHECYIVDNCEEEVRAARTRMNDRIAAAQALIDPDTATQQQLNDYQTERKNAIADCKAAILALVPTPVLLQTVKQNPKVERLGIDDEAINYNKFVILEDNNFTIFSTFQLTSGSVAGYRETELTYAGELVAAAGESITSVLDKIKNMLGDFEYFYDVDGHFVFQRKKTYINTSWNTINKSTDRLISDDIYVDNAAGLSSSVYSFEDNNLITAFQNTPDILNLKNDFSVWSNRKNGEENVKFHARMAIDKKPIYYKAVGGYKDNNEIVAAGTTFCTEEYTGDTHNINIVDWREIIYQMAKDQLKHNEDDSFLSQVQFNNTIITYNERNEEMLTQLYPLGVTGYEIYYEEMLEFWRQVYNPHPIPKDEWTGGRYSVVKSEIDPNTGTYKLEREWIPYTPIINESSEYYLPFDQNYYNTLNDTQKIIYKQNHQDGYKYWHKNVINAPYLLNFWLEFLDNTSDLAQFAIPVVGDRPKVINDDDVTAIYFRETPLVIYTTESPDSIDRKSGYTYIYLTPQLNNLFTVSGQGKCAKDVMDELLYNYTYCTESVSITTLPIYYLEPNTRIFVHDEKTNINGEYIISRLTIPLAYNGTMSISATKAVDRLY